MKNVIFGTGPLGRAVLEQLLKNGETARMVNRSGKMPNVAGNVEVVKADAYDLESAKRAAQGASVVYNCTAPEYSTKAWTTQLPILWGNILKSAVTNNAKLIIGDNLYMYDQAGTGIHEQLPMQSTAGKGKARVVVVQQMLTAHNSGIAQVTFARGADFFGEYATEQSHLGSRVIPALLNGKPAQFVGSLDLPHTMTYIKDFGKAMVMLAAHDEAFGRAWHVPNAPAKTKRQILALLEPMVGRATKVQIMNKLMLQALGLFMPPLREVNEMIYQFEQPYSVDSSQFVAAFGDIHTPLETALQETVAWFRKLA